MLHDVIAVIEQRLNAYLARRFPADQDWVVASGHVDAAGNAKPELSNKLVLTVVNITEEQAISSYKQTPSHDALAAAAPLHLNLFVLLSARFDDAYADGLKLLSAAMAHIRAAPVLTPQNTPNLPNTIEKLAFEISNTELADMRHIWASQGMPALPCALYKIRGIVVDSDTPAEEAGVVRSVSLDR